MPINADYKYLAAEKEFLKAKTNDDKLKALQNMLSTSPTHKGAQSLRSEIKARIARLKATMLRERAVRKTSGVSVSVKKEGAAQIVLVGPTNIGKSFLLHQLTKARVVVSPHPFTTVRPEVGTLDYQGVKLQVVEIPAIVHGFARTEHGPALLALIRQADLMVLMFNTVAEKALLDKELAGVDTPVLVFNHQADLAAEIWRRLNVIKVYTKQPGKKHDLPPVDMRKGSTIRDLAEKVHKDFVQNFKYAKLWGPSAKFPGQIQGLDHVLADDDVVEFHTK
ncbi:MAG TPA: TGS domain-containing protein [Candidatus Nanoarchaeia archaeon]|nr:TGS domain-containing protein [Candidatus Nanoarchaeia archaeon]